MNKKQASELPKIRTLQKVGRPSLVIQGNAIVFLLAMWPEDFMDMTRVLVQSNEVYSLLESQYCPIAPCCE